jgi:hypothetical protein
MAITINEMEVEMKDAPVTSGAAPAEPKPDTHLDLQSALEMLHERKLRLQAD